MHRVALASKAGGRAEKAEKICEGAKYPCPVEEAGERQEEKAGETEKENNRDLIQDANTAGARRCSTSSDK